LTITAVYGPALGSNFVADDARDLAEVEDAHAGSTPALTGP